MNVVLWVFNTNSPIVCLSCKFSILEGKFSHLVLTAINVLLLLLLLRFAGGHDTARLLLIVLASQKNTRKTHRPNQNNNISID